MIPGHCAFEKIILATRNANVKEWSCVLVAAFSNTETTFCWILGCSQNSVGSLANFTSFSPWKIFVHMHALTFSVSLFSFPNHVTFGGNLVILHSDFPLQVFYPKLLLVLKFHLLHVASWADWRCLSEVSTWIVWNTVENFATSLLVLFFTLPLAVIK